MVSFYEVLQAVSRSTISHSGNSSSQSSRSLESNKFVNSITTSLTSDTITASHSRRSSLRSQRESIWTLEDGNNIGSEEITNLQEISRLLRQRFVEDGDGDRGRGNQNKIVVTSTLSSSFATVRAIPFSTSIPFYFSNMKLKKSLNYKLFLHWNPIFLFLLSG